MDAIIMDEMREIIDQTPKYENISSRFNQKWYLTNSKWHESKCVQKAIEAVGDKYNDCITRFHGDLYTPVSVHGKEYDPDHHIIIINGGNNGSGYWRNYIDQIRDFIHELEKYFAKVWMIDLSNDCCDDVYTMILGARR